MSRSTPAYQLKPLEDLTADELAQFERDWEEAQAFYEAQQGPEFPKGEFAPQCNIGPLW